LNKAGRHLLHTALAIALGDLIRGAGVIVPDGPSRPIRRYLLQAEFPLLL
jgi:hypothetical protein